MLDLSEKIADDLQEFLKLALRDLTHTPVKGLVSTTATGVKVVGGLRKVLNNQRERLKDNLMVPR